MLKTLRSDNDARPRFEFYPVNSPTLRTVHVERTPFTIGRGEGTELEINSTSVSREHAQVTRTPSGYLLRDLGSTNGTWVNGQSITEAPLEDGDAVRIADIELTFVCSSLGRLQRMVTQPLAARPADEPAAQRAEGIATQRTLGEALLWQTIPLRRHDLINQQSGDSEATVVSIDRPLTSELASGEPLDRRSTRARIQQLAWQLAAEQATDSDAASLLLLRVEHRSLLGEWLLDAWHDAADRLPAPRRLGVFLSWEWVADVPASQRLCRELRAQGAALGMDQFAGGPNCIDALEGAAPDYLMMAPAVVRGVASQPRQLQRLEIVQASCAAAGIHVVLPGDLADDEIEACRSIQIHHQLGPHPLDRQFQSDSPAARAKPAVPACSPG